MTPQAVPGEWTALDRGGTAQCRLTLEGPASGSPPRATPSGCVSEELFRVAAWQSRGQDLMLLDNRGAPLIMLRPTGAGRYEGTGLSRERYALWR
jgi:hypothetical protein